MILQTDPWLCSNEHTEVIMKLMIGENIRSYRKKNGLTQEEFAERLGVTYQSVSGWENGVSHS